MTDADAVATSIVTGGKTPDNPKPATQHNQSEDNGNAAVGDWVTDEVREVVKAKGWKSPTDAIKSYVELEKFNSKSVQDMSPEERERFLKVKLGRPESSDALELSNVILPEGVQRSADADKELKEVVWKMQALPPKEQSRHLHEWAMKKAADGIIKARAAMKEKADKDEADLRKEWGFDYDANERRVQSLVKSVGGDAMVQYMNSPEGKAPVLRKFLAGVAKRFGEDTLETGRVVTQGGQTRSGMVVDFSKSPELSVNKRR